MINNQEIKKILTRKPEKKEITIEIVLAIIVTIGNIIIQLQTNNVIKIPANIINIITISIPMIRQLLNKYFGEKENKE